MSRPVNCAAILPAAPDTVHEGCPVLTKRRHFLLTKGQTGLAQWQLRWPDGTPADISSCVSDPDDLTSVTSDSMVLRARFQQCGEGYPFAEVNVYADDAANGQVSFNIPAELSEHAGIYSFQIALLDGTNVVFADGGLISVEAGLWGDIVDTNAPPTLQSIRMHLRDTTVENDLLMDVEFDDAEILYAVSHPVMEFNETPPSLSPYSCRSFPFKHFWRNAIVGELLKTAAHHYMRNKTKLTGSSGGLSGDDKDRDREYLTLATVYVQEWKDFVARKKVELNAQLAFDTFGSNY